MAHALFLACYKWLATTGTGKIFCCCLLAALSYLCLPALPAFAHTTEPASGPSIHLDFGFDATYRAGEWTPATISIDNFDANFQGKLTVNIYTGPPRSIYIAQIAPWSYEKSVNLPKGSHQQIVVYVPFAFSNYVPRGVIASLFDTHGHMVATQISPNAYEVPQNDLLIGLLASPDKTFTVFNGMTLPNQTSSPTTASLDPKTFPVSSSALEAFDFIILDSFSSSTLNKQQLVALQAWVNQGGMLIEVGGAQGQQTIGSLPASLQPVTITGTTTFSPQTSLLPTDTTTLHTPGKLAAHPPVTASMAVIHDQEVFSTPHTLLTVNGIPAIVEAHQGQGSIYYLAFDPEDPALFNWPGHAMLWQSLFFHALGERFLIPSSVQGYDSGPGQLLKHGGILSMIEPHALPGPWILVILLLSYMIVIGPVRFWIVKHYHIARWWNWRIFLSSTIIFSLLSYGLASYLQGSSLINNSVTLIQLNQGGNYAHLTSYMGLFVPQQNDLTLNFPANTLAQPLSSQFLNQAAVPYVQDDPPATINEDAAASSLSLHDLNNWTFHPIVSQQDYALGNKGLQTSLSLQNTTITGNITNNLSTTMSDVYLLFPQGLARIGTLPAGMTHHISVPLPAHPITNQALAAQIAIQGGLPGNYFPYQYNQRPQTVFQQHMALLSALSGQGFSFPPCNNSCATEAVITKNAVYPLGSVRASAIGKTAHDPLLLPGATATLIGWTNQPLASTNTATLNGTVPAGEQENFVQMPINITMENTNDISANFIAGHVIDVQSYDAQFVQPDTYLLYTGNITFELTAPRTSSRPGNLTLTLPTLPGNTPQGRLYNWHTHSWDQIQFTNGTYQTNNAIAYLNSDGDALLQVSSKNKKPVYFMSPSMHLFVLES